MKGTLTYNDWVIIVDTGSDKPYLDEVLTDYPWALGETVQGGYDTGAYLNVFLKRKTHPKYYMFMQDSLEVIEKDWLQRFKEKAEPEHVGAVAYSFFPFFFDNAEQREWVEEGFNSTDYPLFGIFGPVFLAKSTALQLLQEETLLPVIPTTKLEQQGCERAWSMAFHLAGSDIVALHDYPDFSGMMLGKIPPFKKYFKQRI